jgi:Holliday junction resolvase
MRRFGRIDQNQRDIVEALRSAGWKVQSAANIGGGFPDLVIARGHDVRLAEVKSEKGTLTADQVRFMVQDGWPVVILRSIDDALAL